MVMAKNERDYRGYERDTDNCLAVHGKFEIEPNEWLIRNCSLMSMPAFNQR